MVEIETSKVALQQRRDELVAKIASIKHERSMKEQAKVDERKQLEDACIAQDVMQTELSVEVDRVSEQIGKREFKLKQVFQHIEDEVSAQNRQEQHNAMLRATFEKVEKFLMLTDNFNGKIKSHIGDEAEF